MAIEPRPAVDILLEEAACLAVVKPSGLLTQAPPGIDSLEVRIKDFLRARADAPEEIYLAVPHRLDRPASGAMVFATHIRSARRLAKQFERRQVHKVYWALVAGQVEPGEGTWRDHLWKTHGRPHAEVVSPQHPGAKAAVLHYQVLGRHEHGSWLEIVLETGRTHQVRIQAAVRGFPLLGDAHYGSQIAFGEQFADERLRAIALHARRLSFTLPSLPQRPVTVTAPLPAAWQSLGIGDSTGENSVDGSRVDGTADDAGPLREA